MRAEVSARDHGPVLSRGTELARLAALLADRTRAVMCLALLDGRAWTVGELARYAEVAASTATEQVHRLVDGGLLAEHRQGRHRYVRVANPRIAELLEAMAAAVDAPDEPVTGLRAGTVAATLARGRTCYDHLAGRLGVAVTDALGARGHLETTTGFALTESGMVLLTDRLGIDPAALHRTRRPVVRPCLDWTERRIHLGGAAGAQLCRRLLELGWLERIGRGRAVRATGAGESGLFDLLGIDPALLR